MAMYCMRLSVAVSIYRYQMGTANSGKQTPTKANKEGDRYGCIMTTAQWMLSDVSVTYAAQLFAGCVRSGATSTPTFTKRPTTSPRVLVEALVDTSFAQIVKDTFLHHPHFS